MVLGISLLVLQAEVVTVGTDKNSIILIYYYSLSGISYPSHMHSLRIKSEYKYVHLLKGKYDIYYGIYTAFYNYILWKFPQGIALTSMIMSMTISLGYFTTVQN